MKVCLAKHIFKQSFSFRMVETDFLIWEIVFSYLIFFLQVEAVTEINGPFLGKTLFPLVERDFLSSGNCFLLFRASFLQVESISETSLNKS